MWDFHQRFGSLPWASLVLPAAEVAREGYVVNAVSINPDTQEILGVADPRRSNYTAYVSDE